MTRRTALTTLSIKLLVDGAVVGAIQSFSSNHARNITKVREIGSDEPAEVVDIVPGVEDITVQVTGFAIKPTSKALGNLTSRLAGSAEGNVKLLSLMKQTTKFSIIEEIEISPGETVSLEYERCLLTNYSRNVTIDGNFIIAENASIAVSNVREV